MNGIFFEQVGHCLGAPLHWGHDENFPSLSVALTIWLHFLLLCSGKKGQHYEQKYEYNTCSLNQASVAHKPLHYVELLVGGTVSLSAFGSIFVLAAVTLGLISVHCTEQRSICFTKLENVIYGKIDQGQVICLLYKGSPLVFGGSAVKCFTVIFDSCLYFTSYEQSCTKRPQNNCSTLGKM